MPVDTVNALVLDETLAREDERAVTRLRQIAGGAPLVLMGDENSRALTDLADRLGAVECAIPATASPELQQRLVCVAAERARLAFELQLRERELEDRTRELNQSETRFRDIIERNADAIVVVDHEGVVRFCNSGASQLFGTPREKLIGKAFGFPMVAGDTTELDLVRNGSTRVVEMRVVETEWEGKPACIASLRDVTDRKRAEEDARRLIREQSARLAAESAARRFRFLAESSSVLASSLDSRITLSALARLCVVELADWAIIYGVDEKGSVQRLEAASRDPSKSEIVREICDHPMSAECANPLQEMLRTRKPVLARNLTADRLESIALGARHLELMRALGAASYMLVPLIARDRAVGALALVLSTGDRQFDEDDLALAQDLALRAALALDNARLYLAAQEANQTKSDFLAVISHDLRTPLTSIIGYAELMIMGLPEQLSEGSQQRLERMRTSARHLLYLLDQLLIFARLDAGREEIRSVDTEIRGIVQEISAVMEPLAAQRGLKLTVDCPEDAVVMQTDPDKLRQVLVNLVGNAVKYTQQGGVTLSVRPSAGQRMVFQVRDTGIGIAQEHIGRIFDPFWQVNPDMRSRGEGTGLGLSVVHRLVKLMGGEITVESILGQGSTFTLTLPGGSVRP
jgi:signal transduction histidine kinase